MTVISYDLTFNTLNIQSKIQFDVKVSNSVAMEVAIDILPVKWMEVYSKQFIQPKSLLHAAVKGLIIVPILMGLNCMLKKKSSDLVV